MAKKINYKIRMKDGSIQEVEGEVVNKKWGIDKRTMVSGEQTLKDGTKRALSSTLYCITYLPNGAAPPLCNFRTLKSAKLLLNEPEFFFDELNEESVRGMAQAIGRFWNNCGWKD